MELLTKLGEIQENYHFLPRQELQRLSESADTPLPELVSVASFYEFFTFSPDENDRIESPYPCRRAGILLNAPAEYDWSALRKARENRDMILPRIADSGLLGRSGGGFPVAQKWEITKNAVAEKKYVVCNADEGELFTGKDRALLERNPNAVLEGMAVCGLAVGAEKGFVYLRGEYADLRERLEAAAAAAPLDGFSIEIYMGHGAYVCGDETALLNSLEGKRGETRLKPPYPGTAGFQGRPTVVNNVESFACVPFILNFGASAFRSHGTEDYPGSKLYTVCGAVKWPGVYEMKAGTTVGELLAAAGGETQKLKAILVGGGSGTLVRPDCLDVPMTIKSCAEHGLGFGTASLRFVGENENLITVVRELTQFFAKESCGTCVPCRVGLRQLVRLLEKLEQGRAYPEDKEQIRELAVQIQSSARCALGQAAVTPVLTLLKNFPEVLS